MGLFDIMAFLKPENLKNKAESYIKEKYNRDIKFEDFCVGLKGIELKNFRLSEEGGFENGIFLEAKNVYVKLDIMAALNKNIDINSLRFEEFSLILIKREDSKFNFSNLLNIKNGQADKVSSYSFLGKDWNIKAEDISLLNGIITFKDMKSGRVICLKGISCCAQEFSFLTE